MEKIYECVEKPVVCVAGGSQAPIDPISSPIILTQQISRFQPSSKIVTKFDKCCQIQSQHQIFKNHKPKNLNRQCQCFESVC